MKLLINIKFCNSSFQFLWESPNDDFWDTQTAQHRFYWPSLLLESMLPQMVLWCVMSTGCKWQCLPGSLGDMSECESHGSSEGLSSHQGNSMLLIRPTQTSLGMLEVRPHLLVTRSSSGPHDQREQPQLQSLLHQRLCGQSGALSSDNLSGMTGHPCACPLLKVRTHSLSPLNFPGQLRETHISHSTPSLFMYQSGLQTPQCSTQSPASQTVDAAHGTGQGNGSSAPGWHTEKWHIWQILSKENSDALPETLVWCPVWLWWTALKALIERYLSNHARNVKCS